MSNIIATERSFLGQRIVAATLLGLLTVNPAAAQSEFAEPKLAAEALIDALRKDDLKTLEAILGSDSKALIASGDPVADNTAREDFVAAYDRKSNIVNDAPDRATLIVGEDDFPLPIPIVKTGAAWQFDSKAGHEELINRRIGRNEFNTIKASLAFVDAQREYATYDRDDDGILEYAQKFLSQEGQMDGLYWSEETSDEPSPLGPIFASAKEAGYKAASNAKASARPPYYGYHYKILTKQGPHAPGGAMDYIAKDNLMGGFALVAYPATYAVSGVMSFMVNHDGTVLQADLGPDTKAVAEKMAQYDPDPAVWKAVPADTASNVPQ